MMTEREVYEFLEQVVRRVMRDPTIWWEDSSHDWLHYATRNLFEKFVKQHPKVLTEEKSVQAKECTGERVHADMSESAQVSKCESAYTVECTDESACAGEDWERQLQLLKIAEECSDVYKRLDNLLEGRLTGILLTSEEYTRLSQNELFTSIRKRSKQAIEELIKLGTKPTIA